MLREDRIGRQEVLIGLLRRQKSPYGQGSEDRRFTVGRIKVYGCS
jgi:hypothetical protein